MPGFIIVAGISYAWLHHRGRNKHHFDYWIDQLCDGGVPHKMPFNYVLEMVCDWLSACGTYEGNKGSELYQKEWEWWEKNTNYLKINDETKTLVSRILWNLKENYDYYQDERKAFKTTRKFLKFWKEKYECNKLHLYF